MKTKVIRVWDPLIRIFHWALVVAFFLAFVTEDELLDLHVFAGYSILALLAIRMVWGLIGTRHARFKDFAYSPSTAIAYLKSLFTLRAKRYIGHNPAGAWMILIMFVVLVLTSLSGLAVYAFEEQAGPLANLTHYLPGWFGEAFEETHELLANFALALIFIHVLGVLIESFIHHENLVRSMCTGKKELSK